MNRLRKLQIDFEAKTFYAFQSENIKIRNLLIDYYRNPEAQAYILAKFGKQACSCCGGRGFREK